MDGSALLDPPDDVAATAVIAPARLITWRLWYRWRLLLVLAGLASTGVVIVWAVQVYRTAPHAFVDLDVYRLGSSAWWHGRDIYGPLPRTVAGPLPFVYPPIAAAALAPLAAVTWQHAITITLVGSMTGLAVTVYLTFLRVWPSAGRRGAVLATAVLLPGALVLEPVWDTFWFGQINIVLMALVVLDCLVDHPKWPRGVLIGVAAAIKLTPAVFVLYFLLRKDYRAAATATITGLAVTALGFAVSWSGSLKYWFGSSGGVRGISGSAYVTNQTLAATLTRWALPKPTQTALWVLGSVVLLVFAVAAIRRANRLGDTPLAMVVTAGFGLLVSPTSWSNHWVYIAPALIVIAGQAWRRRSVPWLLALAAITYVFAEAPFLGLPSQGNRELRWTAAQWLPGNSFTVTAIVALVLFAAPDLPATFRAVRTRLVAIGGR
ncbi:MAG TPA: glycosyltransferase 87 family protein [Pseudonocardiaceae bacterium]|nr:glycosyltransferase 87 family protein [Pseudonocardiaceae bacterium]